jgi:eukaryotic-like serine/threonine-protein kinase
MSGTDHQSELTSAHGATVGAYAVDALSAEVAALRPGVNVGPYRLLRPLGHGGMGTVWLAEQSQPLQREVAVKLLARSLDDHLAEACFLVERQALARLVHPCIAQIYDAGQLPGGALFFALEYVDGHTLDRYVGEQRPSLAQFGELFERICDGVHHAHQRGLVHRDLKPANLLVRMDGPRALPKIIDFGIAIGVAAGQPARIDQRTAVGTQAYMAPEQARPGDEGIDARVDVYALGTTLGKMLCLLLDLNIEADEVRPLFLASLRTRAEAPGSDQMRATLQTLRRRLPVELRTIVCKATETERSARYDSAAALGTDLANWRLGRRVLAMGDSAAYAWRHLLYRHRFASIAALLIAAALLIGSAVALYGLGQARSARDLAEQRRVQAEGLVGAMLGDLANRLRPLGRLDLLETVASEAMRYLRSAGVGEAGAVGALQRARALRTLGEVYNGRQQWSDARSAFTEAQTTLESVPAADRAADPAAWLFEAAQVDYFIGYLAYREADAQAAAQHWQAYLQHAEDLQPLTTTDGTGLLETSYALNNLGILKAEAGHLDQAIADYQRAISLKTQVRQLRPQDQSLAVDLAGSYSWIGNAEELLGHPGEALLNYEKQLALTEETLKAKPDEARWAYEHGLALHFAAATRFALGQSNSSETLTAAIHWLEAANSADPSNRQWLRSLISARCDLAWNDAINQDWKAADIHLAKALEPVETLTGEMDARFAGTLMRASARRSVVLLELGDPAAAEKQLRQAQDWLDMLPQARRIERGEAAHVYWIAARLAKARADGATMSANLADAAKIVSAIDSSSLRYSDLEARALGAMLGSDSQAAADILSRVDALGYDTEHIRRIAHIYQGEP